jgi:5-methyltetrahydrofolate--homocysteine methyltransferase
MQVLIIGERINCTRKRIGQAVQEDDADFIKAEARRQVEAGADVLDINGGVAGREIEYLPWLVKIVQEEVDTPLCLDSADPEALRSALPLCRKRPIVNSITDEPERKQALLPLIKESNAQVVALCMSFSGPPAGAEDRVETAGRLVEFLTQNGVPEGDIYVDACILPLSLGAAHPGAMLRAVDEIAKRFPGVHQSCGLTNVSHGLPARRLLNEVFLTMLMSRGLDAAILDPTDAGLMAAVWAAEALVGRDEYCAQYLAAYRAGKLTRRTGT